MSALRWTFAAAGEPPDRLLKRLILEVFGGVVAPVHLALDPAADGARLLPGEEVDPDRGRTLAFGPPVGPELAERLAAGDRVAAWCALSVSLPADDGVRTGPFLRFGDPRVGRYRPLATLRADDDALVLRLGVAGAPLLPPPARDQGPIDLAWQRATADAQARFGDLTRRALRAGLQVELGLEEVAPLARLALLAGLGETPGLVVVDDDRVPLRPSPRPGACLGCRHANQGTFDLAEEGLLACTFAGSRLGRLDAQCEVEWTVEGARVYAFEPYDGANSTWGTQGNLVIAPRRKPTTSPNKP